jgi:hypothetical protein
LLCVCLIFWLLCMFRSLYSVYCLCVNVYCFTATGYQPNCSFIYIISYYIENPAIYVRANVKRKHKIHGCISTATSLTWTRHNVAYTYIAWLVLIINFAALQIQCVQKVAVPLGYFT